MNADDGVVAGAILETDVEMFEVGFNQKIDTAAMDLYVIYRHFDADITTTNGTLDTEAWQTVIFGSQIKF